MSKKKKLKKAAPKKAVKKTLKKAAPKAAPLKPLFAQDSVTFTLPVKPDGLEVLMGAAYMMIDRYCVRLGGDKKKSLAITLFGKAPLGKKELQEAAVSFQNELITQRVRWQIARENLPVREYIQELAIKIAQTPPQAPQAEQAAGSDELSEAQRKEIDALIAEVESEIQSLKKTPAGADPKKISASWEEKHKPA